MSHHYLKAGLETAKLSPIPLPPLPRKQRHVLVSKRLGHACVSTTMNVYARILGGWQKEAANAFAKAMQER